MKKTESIRGICTAIASVLVVSSANRIGYLSGFVEGTRTATRIHSQSDVQIPIVVHGPNIYEAGMQTYYLVLFGSTLYLLFKFLIHSRIGHFVSAISILFSTHCFLRLILLAQGIDNSDNGFSYDSLSIAFVPQSYFGFVVGAGLFVLEFYQFAVLSYPRDKLQADN